MEANWFARFIPFWICLRAFHLSCHELCTITCEMDTPKCGAPITTTALRGSPLSGIQKSTLSHCYGSFAFYPFESFASVEKPRRLEKIELTLAIENGDKRSHFVRINRWVIESVDYNWQCGDWISYRPVKPCIMQHACGIDGRRERCDTNGVGDRTRQRRGHGSRFTFILKWLRIVSNYYFVRFILFFV